MATPAASRQFHWLPTTSVGRWAVALFAAFFISVAVTASIDVDLAVGRLNIRGAFNLLVLIASGVLAAFAIIRCGERALLVFAVLLPALLALGFEASESIFGPY